MSLRQACSLAITALEHEIQRITVDANIAQRFGLEHATERQKKCYVQREKLKAALSVLRELGYEKGAAKLLDREL